MFQLKTFRIKRKYRTWDQIVWSFPGQLIYFGLYSCFLKEEKHLQYNKELQVSNTLNRVKVGREQELVKLKKWSNTRIHGTSVDTAMFSSRGFTIFPISMITILIIFCSTVGIPTVLLVISPKIWIREVSVRTFF